VSEILCSVGLDVGTTSTQLIVSRLTIENRASGFAVPEMEIADREILYQSPVHFTPLVEEKLINGDALRALVEEEYKKAGITREQVDTGAIIVTGETSRKENARRVLDALAHLAGEFVVATAGPDLESVLAAKGSGAVEYARETERAVLHMDIGGGTTNLALIRDGKILRTGCLNVGGRLIKFDGQRRITYVSPVLAGLFRGNPGERMTEDLIRELAGVLTRALEMSAGRREPGELLEQLTTKETGRAWIPPGENVVVSFSGGVAECIEEVYPVDAFGDLGPVLGQAIRESRLCSGAYVLGRERIRATVIGAGCHSTQLSGSTVFTQNIQFPLKNVPVVDFSEDLLSGEEEYSQEPVVFALAGMPSPTYGEIKALVEKLLQRIREPVLLCLEQDMAKALGQALAVRMPPQARILCIDRVKVGEGSYLDIGAPIGHAMPVVVKTLVLGR